MSTRNNSRIVITKDVFIKNISDSTGLSTSAVNIIVSEYLNLKKSYLKSGYKIAENGIGVSRIKSRKLPNNPAIPNRGLTAKLVTDLDSEYKDALITEMLSDS